MKNIKREIENVLDDMKNEFYVATTPVIAYDVYTYVLGELYEPSPIRQRVSPLVSIITSTQK